MSGKTNPSGGWQAAAITASGLALLILMFTPGTVTAGLLELLFGPPDVTMQEAYEPDHGPPGFDHSAFDQLLRKHVRPGGWVDYRGLEQDREKLQKYLDQLARAPFDRLGRNEKLALLLNAYNAFTLMLILEHYPGIESIRDIPAAKRWEAERWQVGSHTWSLNQIEHTQIRPKFAEPRVHFALVCAAVGCPPLRREAYRADAIDAQLRDQTLYVHRHDRWLNFQPGSGDVHLTKLYDWYESDFEQFADSILQYAAPFTPSLARALDAGKHPAVRWIPYDWSLNSLTNAPGLQRPSRAASGRGTNRPSRPTQRDLSHK